MLFVEKLEVNYGGFQLDIQAVRLDGGIHLVIGPNGSGKTTFFEAMLGLRESTSASIRWNHEPLSLPLPMEIRARVAYLSSNPYLWARKRILDHRLLHEIAYPRFDRVLFTQALARFGLAEDKKVSGLSSGERRMLAFSLLSACQPDLFILDEPFAHLDIRQSETMIGILREGVRQDLRRVVVLSSHHVHWLESFGFPALVLNGGTVVEQGVLGKPYESYIQDRASALR